MEAVNRQVMVGKTILNDWNHFKGDPTLLLGEPRERILLINRLLRAAGIAREKYLALCTRYTLIYKFYYVPWRSEKRKAGQIEAIDDEMLMKMDCQTKTIDSLIIKLEKKKEK
ncbi:unnamed protein product [Strongylus vulgaris]|uniref:Uncharacterized protein n=1 Tax=Strongylus vulgaris TaxID=40348 RepID=A0A3P7IMP3_STRVU|nr:unnamed protein product [Strongylus vulgaris]